MRPAPPSPPLSLPLVVWAILILCALPELVLQGADHGLWGSARWRPLAYAEGAFWAGLLYGWAPNYPGQPVVMFLSYAWLHAGLSHLAGNMATLLWLSPPIARRRGPRGFAVLWLAAVIGGGLAFGLLTRDPSPMVGASGALFGLAADWLVHEVCARQGWRAKALRAAGLGAFLVVINVAAWATQGGHLAWETHLGGFLAGLAVSLFWRR